MNIFYDPISNKRREDYYFSNGKILQWLSRYDLERFFEYDPVNKTCNRNEHIPSDFFFECFYKVQKISEEKKFEQTFEVYMGKDDKFGGNDVRIVGQKKDNGYILVNTLSCDEYRLVNYEDYSDYIIYDSQLPDQSVFDVPKECLQ